MNINTVINEILRGVWLINPGAAQEYGKMANLYLTGNFKGTAIDKAGIMAAAAAPSSAMPGQPKAEKRIGRISMRGVIPAYGEMCIMGADDYLQVLRAYNNNESVSAIVLDMDVQGSSVAAINMIREFADEKAKPIVTLANTCYSGGYWTAVLLSDYIMSYGDISSDFGSIGVLTMVGDARKAMEKDGFKMMIVRAPQSTTKASQMVSFYEGDDKAFISELQEDMRPMADAFINSVKELRPGVNQETEGIFTGSTFSAKEALAAGLIDGIGNEKQAFAMAQALADLQENL